MSKLRLPGRSLDVRKKDMTPTAAERKTVEVEPPVRHEFPGLVSDFQASPGPSWDPSKLLQGVSTVEEMHPSFAIETLTSLPTGTLARTKIMPLLVELQENLDVLHPAMTPHAPEVKAYRKTIGKLRMMMDLFPHVYSDANGDMWGEIRKGLDKGYEAIGGFKDLFDSQGLTLSTFDETKGSWTDGVRPEEVQYSNPRKLEKRRRKVLEWKESFSRELPVIATYLSSPAEQPDFHRKRRDMSRFYWGGVSQKPRAGRTGLHNLKRLTEGLVDETRESYKEVRGFDDLRTHSDEEEFHDLRKRLRSLRNLLQTFPALMPDTTMRERFVKRLDRAVDRYGFIGDLLVARSLESDPRERKKLNERIEEAWVEQKNWQEDMKFSRTLKEIPAHLFKPSQTASSFMFE